MSYILMERLNLKMTDLEFVKNRLYETNASLVVLYQDGICKEYFNKRIIDIKSILNENKNALRNAVIADKVIGKLPASLLSFAEVKEIYADTISEYAIPVLEKYNVKYEYKTKTEYIQNNDKTGMCPMENKYKDEMDIEKIFKEVIG